MQSPLLFQISSKMQTKLKLVLDTHLLPTYVHTPNFRQQLFSPDVKSFPDFFFLFFGIFLQFAAACLLNTELFSRERKLPGMFIATLTIFLEREFFFPVKSVDVGILYSGGGREGMGELLFFEEEPWRSREGERKRVS